MKKILVTLFVLVTIAACTPAVLLPPIGPHSDYPCGLQGKVCNTSKCCWRGDNCGGEAGCQAGYCCFDTNKDFEFGASKPYIQMSQDEARQRMIGPR